MRDLSGKNLEKKQILFKLQGSPNTKKLIFSSILSLIGHPFLEILIMLKQKRQWNSLKLVHFTQVGRYSSLIIPVVLDCWLKRVCWLIQFHLSATGTTSPQASGQPTDVNLMPLLDSLSVHLKAQPDVYHSVFNFSSVLPLYPDVAILDQF